MQPAWALIGRASSFVSNPGWEPRGSAISSGGVTGYDIALPHPDFKQVIVIAGGQGYIVDPETRQVSHLFGGAIVETYSVEDAGIIVVNHQDLAFEAFGSDGQIWHTPRLSWDGFRGVTLEHGRITGEAWSPLDDSWHPFQVDLATGTSSGGSFHFREV